MHMVVFCKPNKRQNKFKTCKKTWGSPFAVKEGPRKPGFPIRGKGGSKETWVPFLFEQIIDPSRVKTMFSLVYF